MESISNRSYDIYVIVIGGRFFKMISFTYQPSDLL